MFKKSIKLLDFKENENLIAIVIFFTSFLIGISYFYFSGVIISPDGGFYIKSANSVISEGISFYYNNISHIYYWGYQTFLAITFLIFNKSLYAVVILQIIVQSIAAVLVFKISKFVFNSTITGLISGIIYSAFWEIFRWDVFILTESLMCMLIVSIIYLSLKIKYNSKFSLNYLILLILNLSALAITRPTALPIIVAVLILLLSNLNRKQILIVNSVIILIALTVLTIVVLKGKDDGLSISGYFNYFARLYKDGIIVTGMPEYNYNFIKVSPNVIVFTFHTVIITIYKALMYWAFIIGRHSLIHKVINILIFIPLYLFALSGTIESFKNESKSKVKFLLLIVVFYNVFHALTEVDFDWRYRVPILPVLIILASYGIMLTLNRINKLKIVLKRWGD